jgi:uncharacterized GH25 family protein
MKTYVGVAFRRPTMLTVALALMLGAGATLKAHDFWIEVSDVQPPAGTAVRVHLKVGEHFAGEPVRRNNARIERFVTTGPDGEREVLGADGAAPAGIVRFERPGVWAIGFQSRPSALQLEAGAFERYLQEEGLEHVLRDRQRRGEQHSVGRERFVRSVKALVRYGGSMPNTGYDRQLGLPLELVPETDPFSTAQSLSLRLTYLGRPLKGALAFALLKDDVNAGRGKVVLRVRTDDTGRLRVPLERGLWLIKAVHMVRVDQPDADWESVWTSLTFSVPGGDMQR